MLSLVLPHQRSIELCLLKPARPSRMASPRSVTRAAFLVDLITPSEVAELNCLKFRIQRRDRRARTAGQRLGQQRGLGIVEDGMPIIAAVLSSFRTRQLKNTREIPELSSGRVQTGAGMSATRHRSSARCFRHPYSSAGSSPSASRSAGPARICSAIRPEFCRIAISILAVMSGLARRKDLEFSRPCPSRWLS